jgi:apolipoprotein N-acyltransferase
MRASVAPILAVIVSAVAYGASFPPIGLRMLAWVALVPLFVMVRTRRLGAAALLTWLWTVLAAYAVGDWFPSSVSTYYQQPRVIGIAFFAGVSSIMAAPYFIAFVGCYRGVAVLSPALRSLLAGAAWVVAEWARSTLLTGNPWAVFGYSQSRLTPLVQVADLTGVYGLSFLLVAVNAAVAEAWITSRAAERTLRGALAGIGVAALAVGLTLGYGLARLGAAPYQPQGESGMTVGIVQGNLDLGSQWRQEFYGRNLDAYMRLTLDALRTERPALIVWPESAMTFFLDEEPLYRSALASMLAPYEALLITGAPRYTGPRDRPRYHNTAFLLSSAGAILGWYDKHRLLPFAEYFPVPSLDFLRRRFARVREFTPGTSDALLPTPAGPAGIVICNEAVFPEIAAAKVRAGAAYLINLANDTWVSHEKFSAQLFDIVLLRAVEQRRYLVRASTSGFSGIVDPWGRVVVLTEPFTQAWVTGTVEPAQRLTVYARVGDLFVFACAGALAGGLLRGRRRVRD